MSLSNKIDYFDKSLKSWAVTFTSGQPIFCEKPVSVDSDEIRECYRSAAEAGVQLMCAFNR